MIPLAVVTAVAMFCAGVVMVRCICVISIAQRSHYDRYGQFIGFGLSYILLAVSAFWAALEIAAGHPPDSAWGFLMASAGLIAFDRRPAACFRDRRKCSGAAVVTLTKRVTQ